MDKEWTTQEGQVTYLIRITRRPGYLPALAHLIKKCALRFYLCHWYKQSIPRSKSAFNPYFLCWHQEPSAVVLEGLRTENTAILFSKRREIMLLRRQMPVFQCVANGAFQDIS